MFELLPFGIERLESNEQEIKGEDLKRLSGVYSFIRKDNHDYPLFAYPKNLVTLFLLDLILARKCRKEKLAIRRKLFLRRSTFWGANLFMIPIFIGAGEKIEPYLEHTIRKDGNIFAKVSQYNGWLEFDYVSREARKFVIECYRVLKEV